MAASAGQTDERLELWRLDMDSSALPRGKPIPPSAGNMAVSRLLIRARIAFGFATFFDGFDVLAIAYVMPVIAPLWHLSGSQIGALISVGFLGQLIGALFFSRLAERLGRVRISLATIALFSVASLGCAGTGRAVNCSKVVLT
jgi:predicted MFS family arabinose efflux permease